ncbi:MAG: hypothetical protein KDE23_13305 [Caldilinea sp.]|nr:hypothetical protein [Caldilinea sp.]
MQPETRLDWEILEAEADEWAEVTMAPAPPVRRAVRWQGASVALGVVALLVALAGMCGYRLWRDAEAGIAATERHIGSLVQIETMRQQPPTATRVHSTQVDDVVVKGTTAMARIVMTETSPFGQSLSHVEARFYERCPAGWRRTEPVAAFWGNPAELDTPTLHFDFYELDRPFVEASAEPIDAYHIALRRILGLRPLAATERITVTIEARHVAAGATLPSGALVESSPYFYHAPPGHQDPPLHVDAGSPLLNRLQGRLLVRSMQECDAVHGIRAVGKPLVSYLQQWLREHAAALPALANGEPLPDENRFVNPAQALAILTGEYVIWAHFPEDMERRSDVFVFSAHAFVDFLVADRGPDAIPALLAAFATQDTWPAVIDEAFGMTMDELLAEWNAYVQRLDGEGTAID